MNTLLVAGCAAAGGLAGWMSYPWAASVPPARTAAEREDPLTPTSAGHVAVPANAQTADEDADPVRPLDDLQPVSTSDLVDGFHATSDQSHVDEPTDDVVSANATGIDRNASPVPTGTDGSESAGDPDQAGNLPPLPPLRSKATERVAATLVTAALLGGAAAFFGAIPDLAAYCVCFMGLVLVSVVDIRVGLVPRKMLYPALGLEALAFIGAAAANGQWRPLGDAAIGGVAAFSLLFAIWWFYPKGMGFGDVRLAGLTGSALGWLGLLHVYVGFLTSFIGGAVLGVSLMAVKRTGRKTKMPFAPALALGVVVGVFWGQHLVNLLTHNGS